MSLISKRPMRIHRPSEQFAEFLICKASLFENIFKSRPRQVASVEGHDRRSSLPFVPENKMTSLLSLLDKPCSLQCRYDIRRPYGGQSGQVSAGLRT